MLFLIYETSIDFFMIEANKDPLLESLLLIAKLKDCQTTAEAVTAGLPFTQANMTPGLFIRASEKIGLKSKLIKKKLHKINPLLLPAVLLFKDGSACVLKDITREGSYIISNRNYNDFEVVQPEQLKAKYSDYCFLVKQSSKPKSTLGLDETIHEKHWFWYIFYKFRHNYYLVLFVSFFINMFAVAMPLFIMNVYDRVLPNNAIETLWVLTTGIFIVIIFDFLMKSMRVYFLDICSEKVDVLVSSKIFQHIMGLDFADKEKSTGIMAHKVQQFENVASFLTSSTVVSLVDIPFIFIFLGVMYIVGGNIVWIPIAAIPILIIIAMITTRPLKRIVSESYIGNAQKQSVLIESLKNFDMIKTTLSQGVMQGRWERNVAQAAKSGVKSRYVHSLAMNLVQAIQMIVYVAVIVVGVHLAQQGELSLGGIIVCSIFTMRSLAPLNGLLNLILRYQMAKLSLQALNMIMSKPLEITNDDKSISRGKLEPTVEFKKVSFCYPEASMPLFENLSFTINKGEKVGIIGPMGVGKSTLLKLIMKFYQPEQGTILVGGIDIRQLNTSDLRSKLAYEQQSNQLLQGTIRDNIVLSSPWVDDQKVIDAINLVGANRFINNHPLGLELVISEDGDDLSGGQKQAITLARTFLHKRDLILLDEPTSAMDSNSELLFINNMREYFKDKTLILVTHRTTLLPLVDRLIVIKDGMVVLDGPREEVINALNQTTSS